MPIIQTSMSFQEYRARRIIPAYASSMLNDKRYIEHMKEAVALDLFEEIKNNIDYKLNTDCLTKAEITASIFIGKGN